MSTRGITRRFAQAAAVLVGLDLAALTFTMITGHDYVLGFLPLVDLDKENNLGTLFSVLLFMIGTGLFFVLASGLRRKGADHRAWFLLGWVFAFLTFDEFGSIHERLIGLLQDLWNTSGLFTFAWIIPYSLLVVVLSAVVGPTILRVVPEVRRWFVLAAALYLSGALGFEAIGGWRMDAIGGEGARPEFWYELFTTVEESLEMAGLIVLVFALLELVRHELPDRTVSLSA